MRESHADRYVHLFRPMVLLLVFGVVLANQVFTPERTEPSDYLALAGAGLVSMASMLAFRRFDPVRVAAWSAVADLLLVFVYVLQSPFPARFAIVLLWPIIVLAYFATPRAALVATVATSAGSWVAARALDEWPDPSAVPVAVYGVLVSGALVSFLSAQGRRVEDALAEALARDRVAFVLARRIRMADDPSSAIDQIARVLGDSTGASQSLVLLLEHDDDYVADLATWQRRDDRPTSNDSIDAMVLDATLRHLIATGYGAVLERGSVRLLSPEDGSERTAPGVSAIDASMHDLLRALDAGSGVVVPLPIAGRVVGAIVLAAGPEHSWSSHALPLLEPLVPQLAAGLAQAVLVRDQRDALDSLERVDRMRDRLIANVSHELRTPLTSTIGFVETLLRDDIELQPADRLMLLEHARDGGLRLLALVEDLLTLGSTRPESLDLSPQPLRVRQLLSDALRGIEQQPDRRVVLDDVVDATVTADRNRMLQVVGNLVINAMRHGCGDVELRCERRNGLVLVDVLDEGAGVAPEHLPELFLPFASFSSRSDSTGLGLAICRAIVEAHGGSIDYARIAGRTRFRVRLPIEPASARG